MSPLHRHDERKWELNEKLRFISVLTNSPSIIRYLRPLIRDVFTVRYANCHFGESIFPQLRGDKSLHNKHSKISWHAFNLNSFDPRTNQCDLEVQRIIHLHIIAN